MSCFKTRAAGGAIARWRIVAHGASDFIVVQAAAATDPLYGVTQDVAAANAGDPVDVALGGRPKVEFGGIVARGDPLTADASGKAVKAVPAAGATVRVIGFAEAAAIAGDVIEFQFAPGLFTGTT